MILYKRNNLIFFFAIFLNIYYTNSQQHFNKSDEFPQSDINIDPKNNCTDHCEYKDKEISLTFENNKLKIKLEVYNIYFYFLIIVNILFLILLLSFFIYKICFKKKQVYFKDDIRKETLLNYIDPKIDDYKDNNQKLNYFKEELNKNMNNENSFMNEELLNSSGLEAPPASKISNL